VGLYPGLVVSDGRVSGSITLGRSRLPVWCFTPDFPSWDEYLSDQEKPGSPHYGVSKDDLAGFVRNLLEMRGEFARLLLMVADAERQENEDEDSAFGPPWWEIPELRQRISDQLRRCLAALEEGPP
jgi:hypothetical protein